MARPTFLIFITVGSVPTYSGCHAHAVILRDVVHFEVRVDGVVVRKFQHLLEGVVDKDEADERGKAFFSEPCKILHQETGICGHQQQEEESWPQANPQPELQVVKVIISVSKQNGLCALKNYNTLHIYIYL